MRFPDNCAALADKVSQGPERARRSEDLKQKAGRAVKVRPGSDLTQYSLLSKLLIWQACEVCHAWCDTRCDGCGCTFYCCREHQKMDWPNHQKHCRALAFYSGRDQKNSVHLANAEKSQC